MKRLYDFLFLVALGWACAPEPTSTATYFHGMGLIPGEGQRVVHDAAMVVDNGEIVAAGEASTIETPAGARRVDLSGRTVMPLLNSLHVHLGYLVDNVMAAENYARESILADLDTHLSYGVGSVLVLGTDGGETAFQIREEQRAGKLLGARLFTVGRGVTSVGGWPTTIAPIAKVPQQVATEEEARAAVRAMIEKKADAIKIWVDDAGGSVPKIAPELYRAAIDEASQSGVPVLAHVFYLEDAKELVQAGVSALAHSIRDEVVDDALVAAMRERNVFYVPTLVTHEAGVAYADAPEWVGEPAMARSVSASVIETLKSDAFVESQRSSAGLDAAREQYRIALENVKKLADGGVRIALGTDSGTPNRFPGYFEHRELELMVDAGLTPLQAIEAGTTVGGEILGLRNAGVIAPGSEASFLVVEGDPASDIRATRNVSKVYIRGDEVP
ncbi:MAG TPA: amidohydrolase family protein [Vicinamibacteria bacterium]|nr:amidohydrolase family protein [Vicinamibacteria bacterium]